jgi:transposase
MAHRYRLAPTPEQEIVLTRHCADARYVWNLALEQANLYRVERGPTPSAGLRQRQLAEARKATWLGEGSSTVQQQALRDFDQAMRNWWGGSHRRPTWRKAGLNEGFCVRDVSVQKLNRKWAQVHVPKLGSVRFRLSRPMPAEHGMARITLDRSGRWHVSFNAPQPTFERVSTGRKVGIDLGIARSITTSDPHHRVPAGATDAERRSRRRTLDGTPLDMPLLLTPGEAQRKRRLQRQMARQQKGSHRRARTKHAIAALSAREADRRRDWTEKVTTGLVRDYDFIAHEDLRPKNMSRSAKGTIESPGTNVAAKRSLNRSILSQNWGTTITRLGDKAAASPPPCEVVAVDPRGSSQECSECHHRARENRKSQAVFHCVSCGHAEHADDNASKNILAAGLAVAGRGGTSHAPSKSVEYAQRPDEASTSRVLVSV